ncbi:MAG: hypothetical protein M1335_03480 [Chloroflexi bacterium]|nr:hypothetical protein [Chloroflexota bacterium]
MREWEREIPDPVVLSAAKQLLVSTGRLSTHYPCTNDHWCVCSHEVITHKDGTMVAICTCDDGDCDPIPVTRSDIVRYQVDFPRVFKGLSKTAGGEYVPVLNMDFRDPVRFGTLGVNGMSVGMYFALTSYAGLSRESVVALLVGSHDPVIVFSISPIQLHIEAGFGFDDSKLLIAINDLFRVDDSGKIGITGELGGVIRGFAERVAARGSGDRVRDACLNSVFSEENDYHNITIRGRRLPHLTDLQADVVRTLHKAQMNGASELSYAAISSRMAEMHADDNGFEPPEKMGKIFRAPDERCDIITSPRRGYYRLNI